ncbi:hypothetical protein M9H77_27717 [Catharanthus roseus]|uniref:Uncharacterized protein n=1 Tax=Catharanthus roseus TaxID=4058 RepID=A0ACC0AE63_CATRO|nr:hypothetical protein M9H77_27717 [Catharanthus roseus]
MAKKKEQSKKQQKRGGVDFKKLKRKVGRKLPPPKNATNTEIKSKAIVLPEQSVASEKTGLAVNKKGLTLKELLQQTSHHNAKVRKDALIGIRDIFLKHPAELKLHRLAAVEKLRERICDDDKLVRETLYKLFKKVILPSCKNDNQGPFISLMMAYIFNAMTHLAIDVRVMAFKFFDLVVQNYPSSFFLYAEKILQNFEDILRKSQFQLQDQSKLESILAGLVHCLTLLPSNKQDDDSSIENEVPQQWILHAFEFDAIDDSSGIPGLTEKLKDLLPILVGCFSSAQSFDCMLFILESIDLVVKFFVHGILKSQKCPLNVLPLYGKSPGSVEWDQILSPAVLNKLWDVFPLKGDKRHFVLNAIITEIFLLLSDWVYPDPALLDNFLGFLESSLIEKISNTNNSMGSVEVFHEKHLIPLISSIPKLSIRVGDAWRSRILKAFTEVFKNCSPESSLKLACLSVLEEILDEEKGCGWLFATDPEMLHYLDIWTSELPLLLVLLDDKHPVSSKAILHLQLKIGKAAILNISLTQNYDQMQESFKDFYSTSLDGKGVSGPFMRLTRDIQELSLSCLHYFSSLHFRLLQSLATCCLSKDMDPFLVFRIVEVLHSTYKAGNVLISDYISFLITLLSRFTVYPEEIRPAKGQQGISNRETYRALTNIVSSSLSQIGDEYLVLQILEKTILEHMSLKLPVDNISGLLRVLITLDSKPTRLSEVNIIKLSHVLTGYLIHIASCIQDDREPSAIEKINDSCYYLLPCFFLFDRSSNLLYLFLNSLKSLIAEEVPLLSPHHTQTKINHSNGICTILYLLLLLLEDIKMKRVLLSHKTQIESITQEVAKLQSSKEWNISIEESHKIGKALSCLELELLDHSMDDSLENLQRERSSERSGDWRTVQAR